MKGKKKKNFFIIYFHLIPDRPVPPTTLRVKNQYKKNTMKLRALIKIPQSIAQIVQQLNTYTFVYGLDIIGTHQ